MLTTPGLYVLTPVPSCGQGARAAGQGVLLLLNLWLIFPIRMSQN